MTKRGIMYAKREIWCICKLIEKSHMTKLICSNALDNQVSQMESILILLLIFSEAAIQRFLLKKRLRHRCFHMNFSKFLRTPLLQNTSGACFYLFHMISLYIFSQSNNDGHVQGKLMLNVSQKMHHFTKT